MWVWTKDESTARGLTWWRTEADRGDSRVMAQVAFHDDGSTEGRVIPYGTPNPALIEELNGEIALLREALADGRLR